MAERASQVNTVEDLLELFNINTWHHLLIGDGSGTRWGYEAGWSSVLIDRDYEEKWFYGGMSEGTNIIAEIMAYVQPLMWLVANKKVALTYTHIITDCEHLVWAAANPHSRKRNKELWHMIDSFRRHGMLIKWHWIPRDTIPWNQSAHDWANAGRLAIKNIEEE